MRSPTNTMHTSRTLTGTQPSPSLLPCTNPMRPAMQSPKQHAHKLTCISKTADPPHNHQRMGHLHVPPCAASASSGALPMGPGGSGEAKTPLQQRILNGILNISNVPYSSYVPSPETFLHRVDARIKQLWLIAIYVIIGRATPWVRVSVAATVALASIIVLPRRLWTSQLTRLGLLCGFLAVSTALFADGIPPVLQPREPTSLVDGLLPLEPTNYNYVVLHVWLVTVTHRSLNLALTTASLTFCALQTASLCLVTTPGEEMAMALRWWLSPLLLIGVKVQEIALTLLLSLRFLSLVFEEVRNLSLGLASRGVDWQALGMAGSLGLLGRLAMRLFGNLFHRSENIAQAMVARGFQGPVDHRPHMTQINRTSWLWNMVALGVLAGFVVAAKQWA